MNIVDKAKAKFLQMVDEFGSDPYNLVPHLPEVERWAKNLLKKYPQADEEVVLIAVWFHDLGHYPIPTDIDHAIRGEKRAKEFLEKENYPKDKMDKVLHCIRSHSYLDVMPESIEAKIVVFADAASHMTDSRYFDMAKYDKESDSKFRVYAKIAHNYEALSVFPEDQKELKELCEKWKELLEIYEKID